MISEMVVGDDKNYVVSVFQCAAERSHTSAIFREVNDRSIFQPSVPG